MTFIRWTLGIFALILASGAALAFIVFIASGIDLWVKRAHNLRRLTSAILLFWFNLEIWRHVVLVIVHW
ncbi:MAG: hypothetical protein JF606_16785 [Burkholderiales bacterium]|jgi:uncharacterized iron-regulated membrane protein|nr:hypothetical protein [Burkholderiales bacterium]